MENQAVWEWVQSEGDECLSWLPAYLKRNNLAAEGVPTNFILSIHGDGSQLNAIVAHRDLSPRLQKMKQAWRQSRYRKKKSKIERSFSLSKEAYGTLIGLAKEHNLSLTTTLERLIQDNYSTLIAEKHIMRVALAEAKADKATQDRYRSMNEWIAKASGNQNLKKKIKHLQHEFENLSAELDKQKDVERLLEEENKELKQKLILEADRVEKLEKEIKASKRLARLRLSVEDNMHAS